MNFMINNILYFDVKKNSKAAENTMKISSVRPECVSLDCNRSKPNSSTTRRHIGHEK